LEQDGFSSVLTDPHTGAIREGTLLVYAPDEAHGFPGAAGADGQFFTADDPAIALPGYTLVTLSSEGEVRFDWAREAEMDRLEPAAVASPDFSDQGILESYNSLIDLLSVRYSYTELRNLDWEKIRQAYLPRVQAADETDDMTAYYLALFDLAMSIRDAHVQVSATDAQIRTAPYVKLGEEYNGSLGAQVVELTDGRFVVTFSDPEGLGAQAGWDFGTEIVSVDGAPMGQRLDTLPLTSAESTPEGIRTAQLALALAFPAGTDTTIAYRQPGESEVLSVTLTAGEGFETVALSSSSALGPGPAASRASTPPVCVPTHRMPLAPSQRAVTLLLLRLCGSPLLCRYHLNAPLCRSSRPSPPPCVPTHTAPSAASSRAMTMLLPRLIGSSGLCW
jgi:hypothetical protein